MESVQYQIKNTFKIHTWVLFATVVILCFQGVLVQAQSLTLSGIVPSRVSVQLSSSENPNLMEFSANTSLKISVSVLGIQPQTWQETSRHELKPHQTLVIDIAQNSPFAVGRPYSRLLTLQAP